MLFLVDDASYGHSLVLTQGAEVCGLVNSGLVLLQNEINLLLLFSTRHLVTTFAGVCLDFFTFKSIYGLFFIGVGMKLYHKTVCKASLLCLGL